MLQRFLSTRGTRGTQEAPISHLCLQANRPTATEAIALTPELVQFWKETPPLLGRNKRLFTPVSHLAGQVDASKGPQI